MKRIQFAVMSLAIALPQAQQPSTTTTAPTSTGSDSQTAFQRAARPLGAGRGRLCDHYQGSRCRWPARRQLCKSESAAVLQCAGHQRRQRAQIILRAAGCWIRWVNLHAKLRCDERQAHGRLQPSRCKSEVRGNLHPCKAPIIANNVSIDRASFRG